MSEPLSIKCDCLKRIEAKYIAIRNEAMEEQESISKVINENSPKYYLELIGLQHSKDCNGIKEIETYVAESKERLEIIRTTQGADALKEDITKWKQTWIKQRDKADKEIKEWVTSRLGELSGNSLVWYWAYVNSIQHLNLYTELAGLNVGWEKKLLPENETLKEIFYSNAIETFLQYEQRFTTNGFLNADLSLNGQKQKLVALIYILKGRGYLKPITGKDRNLYFKVYRQFFEQRYKTDIAEMAKPSKFPPTKAKDFEPDFFFIENLK